MPKKMLAKFQKVVWIHPVELVLFVREKNPVTVINKISCSRNYYHYNLIKSLSQYVPLSFGKSLMNFEIYFFKKRHLHLTAWSYLLLCITCFAVDACFAVVFSLSVLITIPERKMLTMSKNVLRNKFLRVAFILRKKN